MRGHGIRQFAGVGDLIDRHQHFRRDLFVQLDVLLELGHRGAGHRVGFLGFGRTVVLNDDLRLGFEKLFARCVARDAGPRAALDQHLNGAIGQLQQL